MCYNRNIINYGELNMKVLFNKKYNTIAVYTIITFAICLMLVVIVEKSDVISSGLSTVASVLAPITWGIVIAYIMNPVMMWIEKLLKKVFGKKKPHPKLFRATSVIFSIIVLIAAIAALISSVIPQVVDSIFSIANDIPEYFNNLESWFEKISYKNPDVYSFITTQFDTIQPKLSEYINGIIPKLGSLAVKLKDSAIVFLLGLKDFVIGFIVAIYLLFSKELFIAQLRKFVVAIFPQNASMSIRQVASHANKTLSGFISGKLLDSLIIGILCFIVMKIMNMEFVALISVIVGVTNIIPFFGPIIGAVPSALLLLMAAPKQVIPFIIFIIILQQFDGNILGPMILGDSTGLSGFWVMFAIFVGGGLFGFAGMILGVPVFAVIYSLVSDFLNFLLTKKGLSCNTDDYMKIEDDTSENINKSKKQSQLKIFTNFIKIKKGQSDKPADVDKKEDNTKS